ncbi:MAG: ribulose-phosphate 3-epimerase, partial [Dehalococcoidia bacterium]
MPDKDTVKYAPSILSADFARLGEQVAEATQAGADYIHVDVMDGQFVPNLTAGPIMVEAFKPWTHLPLDVHLMIEEPERLIPRFAQAGASILTVHPETCPHLNRVVHQIKDLNVRAGVALNPSTPLTMIEDIIPDIDLVLVMTVNPGFGGQSFIEGMVDKVVRLRRMLDERHLKAELEVDGGISAKTALVVVKAGARVLVAGSAVFNNKESVKEALGKIKESV